MPYSIIENGFSPISMINIFNTDTNANNVKYYGGINVIKLLVNSAGTHMVSISQADNKIIYYNLITSTIEFTITSIPQPVGGLISLADNYLYVLALSSHRLYRVSLTTPTPVVDFIRLSIIPQKLVTNSSGSTLYLAGFDDYVCVVDTLTFTETEKITLYTDGIPYTLVSLVITSDDSTLILADNNSALITTIDLATKVVRPLSLYPYAPSIFLMGIRLSSDNSTIYALGRYRASSYVLKLSLSASIVTFQILQTLPTREYFMVLSPDNSTLYLLNTITRKLDLLSASTLAIQPSIALPQAPYYFTIDAISNIGYAINKNSGLITKINILTNTVIASTSSPKKITAITTDYL